jgi:hypothetical protein
MGARPPLSEFFNPHLTVTVPPDELINGAWFPKIFARQKSFLRRYQLTFGVPVINSWFRQFERQLALKNDSKTSALLSEHCFAAALDLQPPIGFEKDPGHFAAMLTSLDSQIRVGYRQYIRPDGTLRFAHVGWGDWVPYDVIEKYIDSHITTEIFPAPILAIEKAELRQRLVRNWKPGVVW